MDRRIRRRWRERCCELKWQESNFGYRMPKWRRRWTWWWFGTTSWALVKDLFLISRNDERWPRDNGWWILWCKIEIRLWKTRSKLTGCVARRWTYDLRVAMRQDWRWRRWRRQQYDWCRQYWWLQQLWWKILLRCWQNYHVDPTLIRAESML